MSSIAKTNISLSKKDLEKNRIPSVSSRNIVFYHKATLGQLTINLLSLTMPTSEMPNMVQATIDEINGAYLASNKKNLDLVSSIKGNLIQGLDYLVTSSTTIQLIGIYEGYGAEVGEIFKGTVISSPVSNIVVASAKSVNKTYTLAVGQTILNLGLEYQIGVNPNESIGAVKVFVNGILALRNVDYVEVDSGNGYGSTIQFYTPPVSIAHSIAVDFGIMSISDNNSIGAIENLSGAVKKIADDLAVVVGGSSTDYLNSNPSEVERRTFGDKVLGLSGKMDTINSSFPTVQRFISGSGTYIPTFGTKYIRVTVVGGGGGGAGASNNGTNNPNTGGTGGNSTFGNIVAGGGGGGNTSIGGVGGVNTISGSYTVVVNAQGGGGGAPCTVNGASDLSGGPGGSSILGGGARGESAAPDNCGGGGGGSGTGYTGGGYWGTGGGGGAGGGVIAFVNNPGSFGYSVGIGGTGTAGQIGNGSAGGSGIVVVEEFYV